VVNTYCSGYSSSCDGQTSQNAWQLQEDCSTAQKCEMSGSTSHCVPITTCTDTYTSSASQSCHVNTGTVGTPNLCLEVQQLSGASWKYRACMNSGTFPQDFSLKLLDQNHTSQNLGGPFANTVGNQCSQWHDFSVSYISGYGSVNGAGLVAELKWPISCTQSTCTYSTGIITVSKSCL
jgi:hypothetical protein